MGESVVRLLSRNGETSIETAPSKSEKAQGRKRRRVQQQLDDGDHEHEDGAAEDASLFDAAQSQLLEEMAAAGLAGSLPMSFGSKRQTNISSSSSSNRKKRRRVVVEDDTGRERSSRAAVVVAPAVPAEPLVLEKVHVKYDSDGEVAERVVEQVEPIASARQEAGEGDETSAPSDEAQNGEHTQSPASEMAASAVVVQQANGVPVDKEVRKFWKQRSHLFYKYEEGILLDHESWYSVTPQAIAEHIAQRLKCDVVVDPFAGCGGNVIQLARQCRHVIAIDIDPEKIRMAKHNAAIYGVGHKIEWIVGNSIEILPTLKADAVFLSPPWGGVGYSRNHFRLDEMIVKGVSGIDLFERARRVSKNVAYYLPKTTPSGDLEALAPEEPVECEKIFLNKQLKVVTAYYGALANRQPETAPIDSVDDSAGDQHDEADRETESPVE